MRESGGNAPSCAACEYPVINDDDQIKELLEIFAACLPAVSADGVDLASVMAVIEAAGIEKEKLLTLEIMLSGFREYIKISQKQKEK